MSLFSVEGIRVRGSAISKETLVSIWGGMTTKPFPRVVALQLEDEDFDRVISLRRCREDERRELQEWGRVLSASGTDACVFNADEFAGFDYVVLTRKSPYHGLDKVLKHELRHILKGDL